MNHCFIYKKDLSYNFTFFSEPFFKIFDSGEKGIRVDDPKDINIFTEVAEGDKLTSTTTTKSNDQSSGQSSDEEIIARLSTKLSHCKRIPNRSLDDSLGTTLSGTIFSAFIGLFCLGLFCLGLFCNLGLLCQGLFCPDTKI